jgi:hypothetical protein
MITTFEFINFFKELFSNREYKKLNEEFKFVEPIKYQPITKKLNGKLILKWYSWDRNPNSYQNQVNLTACSSIIKSEFLINSSGIPKRGIYS